MSTRTSSSITVTLRKVSTGAKVCAFAMEDQNHAYSIAKVLMRSTEYGRCYTICTSWDGDQLFCIQPEQVQNTPAPYMAPAPPMVPQHHYPMQPQLPAYAPQPVYAQPPPQYRPRQESYIDTVGGPEIPEDPFRPALPAYQGRR